MNSETLSLVQAAHGSIVQAQRQVEDVDVGALLESLRVVINELELRSNADFFTGYCERGERLLEESLERFDEQLAEIDSGAFRSRPSSAATDDYEERFNALSRLLAEVVARLSGLADSADIIERIVVWEIDLLAYRMTDIAVDGREPDPSSDLLAENFAAYLTDVHPDWQAFQVEDMVGITGGFSKVTTLVRGSDVIHGERELIIRSEPSKPMLDLEGMYLSAEYPVVKFVFESGIPVPEPYFLETDEQYFGTPFCVMQRLPGEILGTFEGSDHVIDEAMLREVIQLLVDVERIEVDPSNALIQKSHLARWVGIDNLRDNTRELVRYWYQVSQSGGSRPSTILARAYHWLMDNAPDDDAPCVMIHGDIGFHNILFHEGKIAGILDWENARFGDAAEDLSLFIASTANQAPRDKIIEWYQEAGGQLISEYRLRYFEVFHCFKIIVAGLVSLQRVQESPRDNLHLAVFGLKYVHHSVSAINDLIRAAESEKA